MPVEQIDRRALGDRRERGRHVAVRDQPDARADAADLGHRLLVARAVEHDHHDVAHRHALLLRHQLERLGQRAVQVEQVGHVARGGHLQHVDARARVEHRAALRQRDRGDGVGQALGAQLGALERVDGDVHLGRRAVADRLAVVEHRRLVLLALADHHPAVHRDGVQHQAHRVHRGAVGRLLLAAADPAGARQRRVLRGPHQLHREVAVRARRVGAGRRGGGCAGHRPRSRPAACAPWCRAPGAGSRRRACRRTRAGRRSSRSPARSPRCRRAGRG